MNYLKCVHCIEEYVRLPEDQKTLEAWDKVEDAVTLVPSWQQQAFGLGQLVMTCVALPICVRHTKTSDPAPQQLTSRSGLALPS